MSWRFELTSIDQIKAIIVARISDFPSIIDSFLIDHIYASNLYRIFVDDIEAGYFSIHKTSLITQFYLEPPFSRISQQIYLNVKRMERVQFAFVPTNDEYFLSHALDEYKDIEKQAYFFNYDITKGRVNVDSKFYCRLAEKTEYDFINDESGDFFEGNELSDMLNNREVWISYYNDVCVGFGLIIKNAFFSDMASLGMMTLAKQRRKGYGRLAIQFLINECLSQELRITAGCWYYNHNSKKTLESAGMHSNTRLLKIKY